MKATAAFEGFTPGQLRTLKSLSTPAKIQDFVDGLGYNMQDGGDTEFSPKQVLEHRKAHCLEGAVFAAAALRYHGFAPLLVDLRSVRDQDHTICVFRQKGRWGSIAKSKFVWLGCREPVYAGLHELVMSYFEHYYNYAGDRTLREYSEPVDLRKYGRLEWMTRENGLGFLHGVLNDAKHYKILPAGVKPRRLKGLPFHSNLLTDPSRGLTLKSRGKRV